MVPHFSLFVSMDCFQLRVLVSFSLIVQNVPVSAKIWKESIMYRTPLCDMNDRLVQGCAKPETSVHGLSNCLMSCNLDDTCTGASADGQGRCYFHEACPVLDSNCGTPNPDHKYVVKHCANRGTWQDDQTKCRCRGGMIGTTCEEHPKDCEDLIDNGYEKGYHHAILNPTGRIEDMFNASCFINPTNRYNNYIMFDSEGKYSFDRTWHDYKYGFRIDDNNFWNGLESMHGLTKLKTTKLIMYVQFGGDLTYRSFYDVKVSNESDGYKISFSVAETNTDSRYFNQYNHIGDCLQDVKNIPFSTWDRDQDTEQSRNCASETGSSWWFSSCFPTCNIFGFYPTDPHPFQQLMRVPIIQASTYQIRRNEWRRIGFYLEFE